MLLKDCSSCSGPVGRQWGGPAGVMAWTGGSREGSLCILKVGLIAGLSRLNVELRDRAVKPEV